MVYATRTEWNKADAHDALRALTAEQYVDQLVKRLMSNGVLQKVRLMGVAISG